MKMKNLANLFLILFTLFSASNIALFFSKSFSAIPIFTDYTTHLHTILILGSILLYLVSAFNRHLPKLLFYPLFIWVFWSIFSYWPLPEVIGQAYHLCVGLAQLLTLFLLLRRNYRDNESSYLMVPSQFTGPFFSGRALLVFIIINLIIVPPTVIAIGYQLTAKAINTSSAGFVTLKPNGLYMSEKTYQRDDKTIKLIAMIHLAQSTYYADIAKTIPRDNTLILMEGVSDNTNLLKNRFNYGNLAEFLGLTSQGQLDLPVRAITPEQLRQEEPADPEETAKLDMLPADIDISAFDPQTIEVLDALAKYVLNGDSPVSGYLEFNQWIEEHADTNIDKTIMSDLLDKRNAAVLEYVPDALQRYDTLVLPWGALHMKGLEQAIREKGFSLVENQSHLSIDFKHLPYEQMIEKLKAQP